MLKKAINFHGHFGIVLLIVRFIIARKFNGTNTIYEIVTYFKFEKPVLYIALIL